MIKKLPTKFKNVVSKSEDELVYHMQMVYNSLSEMIKDLERDTDPNIRPIVDEHKRTRAQIAESIELFYGGLCDETVDEEIADLQRQLFNAQSVVADLEELLNHY